ncbi:MAG: site-specific integrase [Cyclobacteriaceae bacterium]
MNGKRSEQSIKRSIEPERWDSKGGRVKGNRADARAINDLIDSIQVKINKIHSKFVDAGSVISASEIRDQYNGVDEKRKTILDVFKYHNELLKQQIGKGFSLATYKRYETTLKHIREFMVHQYRMEDKLLSEVKYQFITDLEFYLKTLKSCNHNSTLKYIRNFRKIVNLAVKNDWIERDPFMKYQVKLKETKREFLSEEELQRVEDHIIEIPRLDQVRDVFVFCCYTGLAFVDVEKLTPKDVSRGIDGDYWIFTERTKTGNSSNIPLLPKALDIIEKYHDNPLNLNIGRLLPVISNQKINAYLKELATLCGIEKNITFHMARHTFATTVTLTNGVSIETVSSMLGHKNIRTTQIYAKVVLRKVSDDMRKLKNVLGDQSKPAINQ